MNWIRRRRTKEFAEAIRPELRDLPAPEPSEGLLDRIIATRRSGGRVILPDVSSGETRRAGRSWIAALIAAALLLALPFRQSAPPSDEPSSLDRASSDWLPASLAFAKNEPSGKMPPLSIARPEAIHPVTLQFLRTGHDSAGVETVRIASTMTLEQAGDAWLIVSRAEGTRAGARPFQTLDSALIAQRDLRVRRHTALERPYSRYDEIRIEQTYRNDSVIGRMHAKGADATPEGRPIARRLATASGPYIVDLMAPFLLGTANLADGWSARASIVGWAVRDDDVFRTLDLRVDGTDTIDVPAGQFECWRLTLGIGARSITYWVRKADGIGVRSRERDGSGGVRDVVLVRELASR